MELDDFPSDLPDCVQSIADAITPAGATGGKDAAGGTVHSLTEAVMGITAALVLVAKAIEYHADVMERKR